MARIQSANGQLCHDFLCREPDAYEALGRSGRAFLSVLHVRMSSTHDYYQLIMLTTSTYDFQLIILRTTIIFHVHTQ